MRLQAVSGLAIPRPHLEAGGDGVHEAADEADAAEADHEALGHGGAGLHHTAQRLRRGSGQGVDPGGVCPVDGVRDADDAARHDPVVAQDHRELAHCVRPLGHVLGGLQGRPHVAVPGRDAPAQLLHPGLHEPRLQRVQAEGGERVYQAHGAAHGAGDEPAADGADNRGRGHTARGRHDDAAHGDGACGPCAREARQRPDRAVAVSRPVAAPDCHLLDVLVALVRPVDDVLPFGRLHEEPELRRSPLEVLGVVFDSVPAA
mmetsp:Transcript_849/g.2629  ORF Transcript_849/g.2629 Transcript_849/m.2629 type:complete len:260 (+) Transcript_849:635-1414(+)